jgi:putative transposase
MTKYAGKYRIESARKSNWDYGSNAPYFVTICTKNREHFFGEIVNNVMNLSEIGMAAYNCWLSIPEHFPFVELGGFIVMPDHVHGIIIINKPIIEETQNFASAQIEKKKLISLQNKNQIKNKFGPQSKNLGSIIRGFKIGVTLFSKNNELPFC